MITNKDIDKFFNDVKEKMKNYVEVTFNSRRITKITDKLEADIVYDKEYLKRNYTLKQLKYNIRTYNQEQYDERHAKMHEIFKAIAEAYRHKIRM